MKDKINTYERRKIIIQELLLDTRLIEIYTSKKQWKKRKEVFEHYSTKYDLLMALEEDIENRVNYYERIIDEDEV